MRCPPLDTLNYWLLVSSAALCGFLWFYISTSIPGVLQFDAEGPDKIFFSKSPFLAYVAFVLTHYFTIRLQKRKFWPDFIEVIIRLLETITVIYSGVWTSIIARQQGRYHNTLYILLGCIQTLAASEITSLLTFIWHVTSSGRFKKRQFITGTFARHNNKLQDNKSDSLGGAIFSKRYKSESKFETGFRGGLALSLLFVFGMIALFVIVVQPLTDVNKVGKDSSILPETQWSRIVLPDMVIPDSSTWSVLIQSPYDARIVSKAVEVTFKSSLMGSKLVANSSFQEVSPLLQTITFADVSKIQSSAGTCNSSDVTLITNLVHFRCDSPAFAYNNAFPSSSANTVITIKVNFTQLGPGIQLDNGQVFEIDGAIKLMVGMADRPEDIMEDAIPFLLFPNLNLISTISLSLRHKVKSFALGMIGWQQYYTFPVAHIETLFPDPIDPIVDKNMSRLKIFVPPRNPKYARYTLNQDSVQSAVTGISFLGGLWTMINGIFSFIFGCSVILVAFGIKPLSIYGLIHLLRKDKPALSDGSSMSLEEQAHIISLLRQHLLDIPEFNIEDRKRSEVTMQHGNQDEERLLPERDGEI